MTGLDPPLPSLFRARVSARMGIVVIGLGLWACLPAASLRGSADGEDSPVGFSGRILLSESPPLSIRLDHGTFQLRPEGDHQLLHLTLWGYGLPLSPGASLKRFDLEVSAGFASAPGQEETEALPEMTSASLRENGSLLPVRLTALSLKRTPTLVLGEVSLEWDVASGDATSREEARTALLEGGFVARSHPKTRSKGSRSRSPPPP